jgi:hypothetical protein
MILKNQSLTLEKGVTLIAPTATDARQIWFAGDTDGGAKLLGEGIILVNSETAYQGGQFGWQAYGGTGYITVGYDTAKSIIQAPTAGTVFRALGPGATITQRAEPSNELHIAANTVIELRGNDRAVGGLIILKNSTAANKTNNAKLTFDSSTSKITTGNTSAVQTTAVPLSATNTTAATGTTISEIGVLYLDGDGSGASGVSVIKATPTVAAVDSKVPSGRLISLEGGTASASITGGSTTVIVDGTEDGKISSLTPTVEL